MLLHEKGVSPIGLLACLYGRLGLFLFFLFFYFSKKRRTVLRWKYWYMFEKNNCRQITVISFKDLVPFFLLNTTTSLLLARTFKVLLKNERLRI